MELLKQVQAKFEWWKLNFLSRAGRLTLAQSVLWSLPIFNMQLERLSVWVHKDLDRTMRRCVWGLSNGRRGVHLLSWEM